jgi:hypothetical protein
MLHDIADLLPWALLGIILGWNLGTMLGWLTWQITRFVKWFAVRLRDAW